MKIRVAHVITGLSRGGAENVLYRLIAAQGNSREFSVISLTDDGVFGERLRELGVDVTCLHMRSNLPSPLAFLKLVRILRRTKPDVVQTWMYHSDLIGGLAARLAGRPVCWGIHHSHLARDKNKVSTLRVVRICALLSRVIPFAIISCSRRAITVHRAVGFAEKFVQIPNGLNLEEFVPDAARGNATRRQLGVPNEAKIVGHVGRADPQKDHSNLIAAFEKIAHRFPEARLLLVGQGLQRGNPYLEGLLVNSGVSERIIALGPRDDVPALMSAMDLFVLSSAGEAFPSVVVEAMASGVPCVVTDVGDTAEIVGDTGWVVPSEDSKALAGALAQALGERAEDLFRRGSLARQRVVENYDVAQMVAAYRSVWDEAGN